MTMTGFGIRQEEIANSLEIDKKTLHKYFRRELDTGMTEANVRVVQALYTNATKNMNVTAQVWWTKTRMGWKGPADDVNIGGTGTPISVDFRWADAITHEPPTIDADKPIAVSFVEAEE